MSWISNLTRPTVKKIGVSKDIPDNFWDRCPKCGAMLFHSEMTKSHFVCPHCEYHFRLPTKERFELLFDDAAYNLIQLPKVLEDPLHFHDIKKYTDRLKDARKKTKQDEAIAIAHGTIGGKHVVIGVFDFDFMGGSMGMGVGQAILTAARLAEIQKAPLILLPASGGARMQEGILSLMQMVRTTIAVKELNKKKIPYITVLTNPTTGGVTASFAMLSDITLAEPGAIIGFAGSRVIEQTIHETLPPDFQKSEYLLKHGMIDHVVHRKDLREKLIQLLKFFD